MKLSKKGKELIAGFEGLRTKPYLCSAKVATIGIGSTRYEDGRKVSMSDEPICTERAYELFEITVKGYENAVNKYAKIALNQNQFDALVSLCYNIGVGGYSKSTVVRYSNADANGIEIQKAFLMWNKVKGKVSNGLTRRRIVESSLYNEK